MNKDLYATVCALIDADENKAKENLSQYINKTSASVIASVGVQKEIIVPMKSSNVNESVFEILLHGKVLDTISRNDNEISNENDIKTMLIMRDGYDPDIEVRRVNYPGLQAGVSRGNR